MPQRKYKIELEIYESGCRKHKVGEKYAYPGDLEKMCPWLMDSANTMIRVLQMDGKLPWTYPNTPYQKEISKTGVTTEYIRCPDPTSSGVVLKVIRTKKAKKK
jgi:uncharacterized repeat protein (TIGR04076 family)